MTKEAGLTRKCRQEFQKCRFAVSGEGYRAVELAAQGSLSHFHQFVKGDRTPICVMWWVNFALRGRSIIQACPDWRITIFQTPRRKGGFQNKPVCSYKQSRHSEAVLAVDSGNPPEIQVPRCQLRIELQVYHIDSFLHKVINIIQRQNCCLNLSF